MDWLDHIHIYFVNGGGNSAPHNWIYHYQALISGGFALLAAGGTAFAIIKQISVSKSQHRELVNKQYRSARAKLAVALMQLSDYAQECIAQLEKAMANKDEEDNIKLEISCPNIPTSSIDALTELIALSSEDNSKKLRSVVRFFQVQHSRLRSTAHDLSPSQSPNKAMYLSDLRHDVLDACVIQKMIGLFWDFARWKVDNVPEFKNSGLNGRLEYTINTKFDQATIQYIHAKLIRYTAMEFEERKGH